MIGDGNDGQDKCKTNANEDIWNRTPEHQNGHRIDEVN